MTRLGASVRSDADRGSSDIEQISRALLLHTADPACVTDVNGMFKYVVSASSLGYSPDELANHCSFDLVHPADLAILKQAYADVIADSTLHPAAVYRARSKNGTWRWREAHVTNLLDDPVVAGIVCNVTDVTEHMALLAELRAADARQRAIVARSRDATLFFDGDGTIRWASPVSADLLGVPPAELLSRNGLDFVHPGDQERVFAQFASMLSLGDHVRTEFRVIDVQGNVRWMEEDATNLVDDPDVGYVVGNLRDITDRKRVEAELERLALHDQLTGLPNRSLLVNRLEHLIARGRPVAILLIDVDNFSDVNDSLGHAAGDELLRLISERLIEAVARTAWTLARVGGDQFVLLCDDVREATTAFSYAELLRESLEPAFPLAGQEIIVTASVGVSMSPGDATGLMRDAAMATHQAKAQGRDRIVVFHKTLDVTQQHRLAVQGDLRRALVNDELVVWYQPIIDLQTGRVTAAEALVRWNHPERGLLGPEHFIDIAETSGLISALGSEVLRKACAAAHTWRELGHPLCISVNAAAAQLSSRAFVSEIEAALPEFDLDPEQVTIELTETAAMQIGDSLDNLQRIRALGVHLSLDDFGTGYSSLSFLRELPVDAIKIDRSFVVGLGHNARDGSIVEGVVAMAGALGYDVVAEGVETTEQADTLRSIGCRYAQGFLWSRPAPAAEIQAIARRIELNARPLN